MNRSNSTRARGKNQRGAKVTNNVPRQENKKPMPGAKETSVSDEDYDEGFKENKKRVARSPPEEVQKMAARKLDKDLTETDKHKDIQINPQGESRREIDRRQLADVKECLNIDETEETDGNKAQHECRRL